MSLYFGESGIQRHRYYFYYSINLTLASLINVIIQNFMFKGSQVWANHWRELCSSLPGICCQQTVHIRKQWRQFHSDINQRHLDTGLCGTHASFCAKDDRVRADNPSTEILPSTLISGPFDCGAAGISYSYRIGKVNFIVSKRSWEQQTRNNNSNTFRILNVVAPCVQ